MASSSSNSVSVTTRPLILLTHEFYPHRGGIAVYAAEMAKAASELGYLVEVWAPVLPPHIKEPSWVFKVRRLPLAGDHSLLSQARMAWHLWINRQALHKATVYIAEPGPLLAMLVLQYGFLPKPGRLFLTLHGSEIQRLASRNLLSWSTAHLWEKTIRLGVVSRFGQALFARHFPAYSKKVVITPGALRTDLAPHQPRSFGRIKDKIIILTVARLNPRKGQLQIITALKALSLEQRARVEYWLVGTHSKENYDQQLAAEAAQVDFPIKFLGAIPDEQLDAIYQQADIFAMTSMPHKHSVEGFGLVYLEAGAHGLPVIAHDIGGVPDAVTDGETGLLVPPGDIPALTTALSRLIGDPVLRQKMGTAGRQRAFAHTWRDSALALFGPPADLPSS